MNIHQAAIDAWCRAASHSNHRLTFFWRLAVSLAKTCATISISFSDLVSLEMLLSKSYHESLSDNICSNLCSQFADVAVCWIPHIFSEGAVSLFIVYLHIYIDTPWYTYIYIHIIDRYIIYLLYRLITKRTRLPHRLVKVCDILHLQGGDPAVRDSLQTKILWYIYYIMYIIYNYIYILNIKHIKPK